MATATRSIAILVVMNLFWAASYAVIKYGLGSMDPLALVFWRLAIGLAVVAGWIFFNGSSLKLDRRDAIRIAFAGIFLAASSFLTVTGIEMSNATDASLLYVFEPVWGIILASLILKERFLVSTGIGLAFVLAGLLGLSGFDLGALVGAGDGGVGLGNVIMVIGLLSESLFTIVLKPVARRRGAPVVFAAVLLVAVATLAVPLGARGEFTIPISGRSMFAIAYLSVICTAMGYTLWVAVMRHVPVNVMLFTIFIQPVAGMLIAWATLGEALDVRLMIGGSFLMAGMAIAVAGHVLTERGARRSAEDEPVALAP